MEKRYTKSKIIILSIAILLAILSFSIGIFGLINKNKKDNKSKAGVAEWSTSYWLVEPGNNNKYTVDDDYLDKADSSSIDSFIRGKGYNPHYSMSLLFKSVSGAEEDYTTTGTLRYYDSSGEQCLDIPVSNVLYYRTGTYKGFCEIENIECNGDSIIYNNYGYVLHQAFKAYGYLIPIHWKPAFYDKDDYYLSTTTSRIKKDELKAARLEQEGGWAYVNYGGITFTIKREYHYNGQKYTYTHEGKTVLRYESWGFHIETNIGLMLFAHLVNEVNMTLTYIGDANKHYAKLYRDINMSGISMPPIGTKGYPYSDVFDGKGHTISNLNFNSPNYGEPGYNGLFGCVSTGSIQNLYLKGAIITQDDGYYGESGAIKSFGLGGLVGVVSGSVSIENCIVNATIIAGGNSGGGYSVGGLIGLVYSGSVATITNCLADIKFQRKDTHFSSMMIGGFVGTNYGELTVKNCCFNGSYKEDDHNPDCYAIGEYNLYFGGVSGSSTINISVRNTLIQITNFKTTVSKNHTYAYVISTQINDKNTTGNKFKIEKSDTEFSTDGASKLS